MRKVMAFGFGWVAFDTDKADLILRYIPDNIISRITKYPMIEIYRGRENGLYFKVFIYPMGRRIIEPTFSWEVRDLVAEYFHEDSETFKKYGPEIEEA